MSNNKAQKDLSNEAHKLEEIIKQKNKAVNHMNTFINTGGNAQKLDSILMKSAQKSKEASKVLEKMEEIDEDTQKKKKK